jgi:hypothetical protein
MSRTCVVRGAFVAYRRRRFPRDIRFVDHGIASMASQRVFPPSARSIRPKNDLAGVLVGVARIDPDAQMMGEKTAGDKVTLMLIKGNEGI